MPNDIMASDLIPVSCEGMIMKDWTNYPSHRRLCRLSNLTNHPGPQPSVIGFPDDQLIPWSRNRHARGPTSIVFGSIDGMVSYLNSRIETESMTRSGKFNCGTGRECKAWCVCLVRACRRRAIRQQEASSNEANMLQLSLVGRAMEKHSQTRRSERGRWVIKKIKGAPAVSIHQFETCRSDDPLSSVVIKT